MKKAWVLSYPLSPQQGLWSKWADAQADLSPDQIGWMPRLIWVLAGHTCHLVGFVMRRLIFTVAKIKNSRHKHILKNLIYRMLVRNDTLYINVLRLYQRRHVLLWCNSISACYIRPTANRFLSRRFLLIHSLKWHSAPFSSCKLCLQILYPPNMKGLEKRNLGCFAPKPFPLLVVSPPRCFAHTGYFTPTLCRAVYKIGFKSILSYLFFFLFLSVFFFSLSFLKSFN